MARAVVWSLPERACAFVCSVFGMPFPLGPLKDSGFLGNLPDSLLSTKHTFEKDFLK